MEQKPEKLDEIAMTGDDDELIEELDSVSGGGVSLGGTVGNSGKVGIVGNAGNTGNSGNAGNNVVAGNGGFSGAAPRRPQ